MLAAVPHTTADSLGGAGPETWAVRTKGKPRLRTHPVFPGGGAGSPLVLMGGLCGEGVGDGDGDEEKDRDLGSKEDHEKEAQRMVCSCPS